MIRHGKPADATQLAELATRTFRDTFAADSRPDDLALYLSQTYGVPQQEAELANPEVVTLLAEVDESLIGYAQLRIKTPPACVVGEAPIELWRFYIDSSWHGRGVAQRLMREVETEAFMRERDTLWLGVWERNERAKAFYRKYGFADVGSHVFLLGTDRQTDRILVRSLQS